MNKKPSIFEMMLNRHKPGIEKRKQPRMECDGRTWAELDTSKTDGFLFQRVAIVLDISKNGCRLLLKEYQELKVNSSIKIKIGSKGPFTGKIKWIRSLDNDGMKCGLELTEGEWV